MFRERVIDLARRKEHLRARCTAQRAAIVQEFARWQEPARMIDRALAAVHFLKVHPAVLGVAVAAVMVLGRRHLLTWLGRGLVAWRAWRSLSEWLRSSSA